MIVELHLLQNFAPSNLNRDETGAPKSAIFGGYTRARVSSQSIKRAARRLVVKRGWLEPQYLGKLSKLFKESKNGEEGKEGLVDFLVKEYGKTREEAGPVADALFERVGLKFKTNDELASLLYLGNEQIAQIKKLAIEKWDSFQENTRLQQELAMIKKEIGSIKRKSKKIKDSLDKASPSSTEAEAEAKLAEYKTKLESEEKKSKAIEAEIEKVKKQLDEAVGKRMREILDTKFTSDIAMFGRMIADAPEYNIDAACQVAHPISTHIVGEVELDYFTALDDLKPKEKAGAAHVDTADFNSACYYRYANVDVEQLKENLRDGEAILPKKTLEAFLRGFIEAVPTGKQNTFASPTETSLALVVVREAGTLSLANAFAKPVQPKDGEGLIELSIEALDEHFSTLRKLCGEWAGITKVAVCTTRPDCLKTFKTDERVDSLPDLVRRTIEATFPTEQLEEKSS